MTTKHSAVVDDKPLSPEEGGENEGLRLTLHKPVKLGLLEEEIAHAHNWRKMPGLSVSGNLAEASAENPVILWVHREDAEAKKVIKAIEDHVIPHQQEEEESA